MSDILKGRQLNEILGFLFITFSWERLLMRLPFSSQKFLSFCDRRDETARTAQQIGIRFSKN